MDLTALTWNPGNNTAAASGHDVYFGTDANTVAEATAGNPLDVYKGRQDSNSWNPGELVLGQTYFWRVDQIDAGSGEIYTGDVWSFTMEAALMIDDYLSGKELVPIVKPEMINQSCLSKELFKPRNRGKFCVTDAKDETLRCISCGTCRDCSMCLESCPEGAIERIELEDGTFEYVSDDEVCIGCSICAGICPCGVWAMETVV